MRRHVTILSVAAAVAAATPPAADATAAPVAGRPCSFGSMTDALVPSGERYTGTVYGGPVVVADGVTPAAVRMTCTIQTAGHWHSDPDAVSVTSPTTLGVAVLPPSVVTYELPWTVPYESLCSRIDVEGGPTYYWDFDNAVWSTDPEVACTHPIPIPPAGPLPVPWEVVDAAVCEVLVDLAPGTDPVYIDPTGDTYVNGELVWDCPPYEF